MISRRQAFLAISFAALCLGGPAARAGLLTFTTATDMSYSGYVGTIHESPYSAGLQAFLSGTGYANIASATNFDLSATLNFTGGNGSYSATGSVILTDWYGPSVPSSNRVAANFTSTGITVSSPGYGLYFLNVEGRLTPQSGDSILVGGDPTWTFHGDNPTSISISDPTGWTGGSMVTFQWGLGSINNLNSFFGSSVPLSLINGTTAMTIVPLPASVLLGVFAVGLAGRKLRKSV
jgi:hypothetical protein